MIMIQVFGLMAFAMFVIILMALGAWCEDNWTVTDDGDIQIYIKEGKDVHFKNRSKRR